MLMRRIGLIGGITWAATADYYRLINLEVRRRLGGDHSADMVIRSLDLHPLRSQMDDQPMIERVLSDAGHALLAADAAVLGVASFTGHRFIAKLHDLPIHFVDLIDCVGISVSQQRIRRLAVWATSYALCDEVLIARLANATGAHLLMPEDAIRAQLDRLVFEELAAGELRVGTLQWLQGLMNAQVAAGAEGLLFATTDFSALISQVEISIPVFDATRIHCEALVDAALSPHRR